MPRKRYTPEEILQHLRTVELDTGKGLAVLDACRKLGITEQTYYRWKKEYGGLRVDQAKRLKSLEQENARLKRIVADLSLDNSILKDVASGNFSARLADGKPWDALSPCSTCLSVERVGRSVSFGPPIGTGHGGIRARSPWVSGSLRSPRSTGGMGIGRSRIS
jgi:transposase-like protein